MEDASWGQPLDLSDLAAGLYRIFLLPRPEADGGTRAIVVADLPLIRMVQLSIGAQALASPRAPREQSSHRRHRRLGEFLKHVERLPPLGEWRSSAQAAGAAAQAAAAAEKACLNEAATVL